MLREEWTEGYVTIRYVRPGPEGPLNGFYDLKADHVKTRTLTENCLFFDARLRRKIRKVQRQETKYWEAMRL